mmetsp:Transcript_19398/g.33522  ORF Transcript_19398/g.33522 Transcript_19398/m.33522 type:complete len:284 (-) Transcript_19398:26-877(-)
MHVIKCELGVVNSIAAHLVAHVIHADSLADGKVLVPDPNQEPVDPVVFAFDHCLGEDNRPMCVHSPIGDPVLLSQDAGCVDGPHLSAGVVLGGGLHFDGIVSKTNLREGEAAHSLQGFHVLEQQIVMLLCSQLQDCPTKQVGLHSALRCGGRVTHGQHLVSGKNAARIGPEIFNVQVAVHTNLLEPHQSQLPLLTKLEIIPLDVGRVTHEFLHLFAHLQIVALQQGLQLMHRKSGVGGRGCGHNKMAQQYQGPSRLGIHAGYGLAEKDDVAAGPGVWKVWLSV